jgi:hypothetical protein
MNNYVFNQVLPWKVAGLIDQGREEYVGDPRSATPLVMQHRKSSIFNPSILLERTVGRETTKRKTTTERIIFRTITNIGHVTGSIDISILPVAAVQGEEKIYQGYCTTNPNVFKDTHYS